MIELLLGAGAAALILAHMLRRKQQIKDQKQQQQGEQQGNSGQRGQGMSQSQTQSNSGGSGGSSGQGSGESQALQPQEEEFEKAEYSVFDDNADQVANCYTPEEAKEALKEKAGLRGTIFNNQTGEEVEPKLDLIEKITRWLKNLGKKPCRKPVFQSEEEKPQVGPMSQEQINRVLRIAGRNPRSMNLEQDENLLRTFLEQINLMDLPVFNVAKKRYEETYQLVEVKKRRRKVRPTMVVVPEEKTISVSKTSIVPSIIPAQDIDVRPIRTVSELRRLHPKTKLALPRWLLGRQLVSHELPVIDYLAEETSKETTSQIIRRRKMVDELYIEEYMDTMEVAKEPKGQLLYILLDGSGSMRNVKSHMAAATAMAVIGRHLEDTSRYLYRLFTTTPEQRHDGMDKSGKENLLRVIIQDFSTDGGTDIPLALSEAVKDIRAIASPEDKPEILLISDGEDTITAEQLYSIIGEDIILHTVLVNQSNSSLKAHSSTYVELHAYEGAPEEIRMRS